MACFGGRPLIRPLANRSALPSVSAPRAATRSHKGSGTIRRSSRMHLHAILHGPSLLVHLPPGLNTNAGLRVCTMCNGTQPGRPFHSAGAGSVWTEGIAQTRLNKQKSAVWAIYSADNTTKHLRQGEAHR
jgi:hypothetical protein